jgi:hypothetical protein
MRGLYAHPSDCMRDDLKAALQARWEDSIRARAAIHGCSPVHGCLLSAATPVTRPTPEQHHDTLIRRREAMPMPVYPERDVPWSEARSRGRATDKRSRSLTAFWRSGL